MDATVRPMVEHAPPAPTGALSLWTGVLAGPVAVLVQLEIVYALASWACVTGDVWVLHLASLLAVLLAAGAVALGVRNRRRAGQSGGDDEGGSRARAHFLAVLAVLLGALSLCTVIALWLPLLVLGPCART